MAGTERREIRPLTDWRGKRKNALLASESCIIGCIRCGFSNAQSSLAFSSDHWLLILEFALKLKV